MVHPLLLSCIITRPKQIKAGKGKQLGLFFLMGQHMIFEIIVQSMSICRHFKDMETSVSAFQFQLIQSMYTYSSVQVDICFLHMTTTTSIYQYINISINQSRQLLSPPHNICTTTIFKCIILAFTIALIFAILFIFQCW